MSKLFFNLNISSQTLVVCTLDKTSHNTFPWLCTGVGADSSITSYIYIANLNMLSDANHSCISKFN